MLPSLIHSLRRTPLQSVSHRKLHWQLSSHLRQGFSASSTDLMSSSGLPHGPQYLVKNSIAPIFGRTLLCQPNRTDISSSSSPQCFNGQLVLNGFFSNRNWLPCRMILNAEKKSGGNHSARVLNSKRIQSHHYESVGVCRVSGDGKKVRSISSKTGLEESTGVVQEEHEQFFARYGKRLDSENSKVHFNAVHEPNSISENVKVLESEAVRPNEDKTNQFKGSVFLRELHIKDFIIVKNLSIEFGPTLNILTGESGAGKSIILGAINQVLGAPMIEESVRQPASSALLHGSFSVGSSLFSAIAKLLGTPPPSSTAMDSVSQGTRETYHDLLVEREIHKSSPIVEGSTYSGRSKMGSKSPKGRSICRINGTIVPLKILRAVGALLVDVNGQNSQVALRMQSTQLNLLDYYANTWERGKDFGELVKRAFDLSQEKQELEKGGYLVEDDLRELVADVEGLHLNLGEVEDLKKELRMQETAQLLAKKCSQVHNLLTEGGMSRGEGSSFRNSTHGRLQAIQHELISMEDTATQLTEIDVNTESVSFGSPNEISNMLSLVSEAENLLQQAEASMESFASEILFSEQRITDIKNRLRKIDVARRKHNACTSEDLIFMAEEAVIRLSSTVDTESKLEEIETNLADVATQMGDLAVEISRRRRVVAESLQDTVEEALSKLGMREARFRCDVSWEMGTPKEILKGSSPSSFPSSNRQVSTDGEDEDEEDFTEEGEEEGEGEGEREEEADNRTFLLVEESLMKIPRAMEVGEIPHRFYRYSDSGLDKVSLKLAANSGEPLLPLSQVASGGECARVMLALKTLQGVSPSPSHSLPLTVFDEIDSGVGGRIGRLIGQSLRALCETGQQVLCVTHLPQVAVYADTHIKVAKGVGEDLRVRTLAFELRNRQERVEEIASMLGLGIPAAVELFDQVRSERGTV